MLYVSSFLLVHIFLIRFRFTCFAFFSTHARTFYFPWWWYGGIADGCSMLSQTRWRGPYACMPETSFHHRKKNPSPILVLTSIRQIGFRVYSYCYLLNVQPFLLLVAFAFRITFQAVYFLGRESHVSSQLRSWNQKKERNRSSQKSPHYN